MATAMQAGVQKLLDGWRTLEDGLGFGVGTGHGGPATVGRIGSEGHLHYTAIGNVVNLASRLCSSAEDSRDLLDRIAADAVRSQVAVPSSSRGPSRGFDQPIPVFSAVTGPAGRPARWERPGRRPSYPSTAVEIEPVVIDLAPRTFQGRMLVRKLRPTAADLGLTVDEGRILRPLTTPWRIQEFLIGLGANFEEEGDTLRSVRGVLRHRRAHCIEARLHGGLCAVAARRPALADGPRRQGRFGPCRCHLPAQWLLGRHLQEQPYLAALARPGLSDPRVSSRCRISMNTPTSIARPAHLFQSHRSPAVRRRGLGDQRGRLLGGRRIARGQRRITG